MRKNASVAEQKYEKVVLAIKNISLETAKANGEYYNTISVQKIVLESNL